MFGARVASSQALIDIRGADLNRSNLIVAPGVFRMDEQANTVTPLCVPSDGKWLLVHSPPLPCPVDPATGRPPPSTQVQVPNPPPGRPYFVIGNLGIDNGGWERAALLRSDTSVPESNKLRAIARAAELRPNGNIAEWHFDSSQLPSELRAEIPGAGTFMHVRQILPEDSKAKILDSLTKELRIETKLSLPLYRRTGAATTTLGIAVGLQTLDSDGKLTPLPLLVGVFASRGNAHEFIGSDGRNQYAGSMLLDNATFLRLEQGRLRNAQWSPATLFAFAIDQSTLAYLIAATSAARVKRGKVPLDPRPELVVLKSLDLRTESRFLDKGTIAMQLDFEYLRAIRIASSLGQTPAGKRPADASQPGARSR
jgi:hypothetical protein